MPSASGVNVAVYVVPEPEKAVNVPLTRVIIPATKSLVDNEEVNVKAMLVLFVVSPLETVLLVIVIVGIGVYVQLNVLVA